MKILHPNNNTYLPLEQLKEFYKNGYYKIIDRKDEHRLNYFLESYEAYRNESNAKIIDPSLYPNLPFSINSAVWKERQRDVKIIETIIQHRAKLQILDLGSWNGWLSNHLAKKGHDLVTVNIFIDEIDGLKAHKNYETKFVSLQLFVDDINRIEHKFDLIVFNRNWTYIKNHEKIYNTAKNLLTNNGVIVFTGLPFYKKSTAIKKKLILTDEDFKNKYGISLYYNTAKGYLDNIDYLFFKKNNIEVRSYSKIKKMIKMFFPNRVELFYGIYKK